MSSAVAEAQHQERFPNNTDEPRVIAPTLTVPPGKIVNGFNFGAMPDATSPTATGYGIREADERARLVGEPDRGRLAARSARRELHGGRGHQPAMFNPFEFKIDKPVRRRPGPRGIRPDQHRCAGETGPAGATDRQASTGSTAQQVRPAPGATRATGVGLAGQTGPTGPSTDSGARHDPRWLAADAAIRKWRDSSVDGCAGVVLVYPVTTTAAFRRTPGTPARACVWTKLSAPAEP